MGLCAAFQDKQEPASLLALLPPDSQSMTRTGVQDTKAKCQNSLFDFVSSVQRSDVGRRLCFHRESLEENKTKPTPPPILGPPVPGFRLGPGLLTHQMCRCWSLPVGSTPHHLPSGTLLQLFFLSFCPDFHSRPDPGSPYPSGCRSSSLQSVALHQPRVSAPAHNLAPCLSAFLFLYHRKQHF